MFLLLFSAQLVAHGRGYGAQLRCVSIVSCFSVFVNTSESFVSPGQQSLLVGLIVVGLIEGALIEG